MDDIASLFFGDDDAAQQRLRAQAMSDVLRKRQTQSDAGRAIGNLGLLTGDKVLGGFGQAQIAGADKANARIGEEQQLMGQAGHQMQQRVLQRALETQKQSGEDRRLKLTLGARDEESKAKALSDATAAASDGERKLRNDFMALPTTKEMMAVATSYKGIKSALAAKTPAGDMAGIFSFMKLMDPGSTVREGEYANAQNSANVPDQIRNMYNKALSGTLLSGTQRQDFLARAQDKFDVQRGIYNQSADAYRKLAPPGANADNIIPLSFDDIGGAGPGGEPTDSKDVEALDWAKRNPTDPRAKVILEMHGGAP